jgi:hypothetical protein
VFFRTGAIIRRFAHSIVFVLPVSVAFSPHSVAENATSTSPGTNLPQLLIEQGWQQKTDADGNTIIYLPADKSEAQPAMPDIVQQLRERGWEMRTDTEGNTLLIRVDQNTWSPAKQQPASPAVEEAQSSAGAPSTVPPDVETLLRERGWRMETDADGAILLAPTGSAPSGSTEIDTTQVPDPFLRFRQALREKGWRVEPAEDGAVIIYPPVKADELFADPVYPAAPDKRGHYQGIALEAVTNGEIELPVDNQSEARKLAAAWVESFGGPGLTVGKVRQISRIYAVSVVETETPYLLRNQLIIRRDNGRVIAIY